MADKKQERTAFRCSTCSIHWPMMRQYEECPLCEGKCFTNSVDADLILSNAQAQARVLEAKRAAEALEDIEPFNSIHPPQVYAHRYSVFMDMGFGPLESESLANTRQGTHRIRKSLASGCTID